MAPILRRTTSDTYARHSTMSSVVGTGTGAFSTAFGASSLLHAASGSTKQATSRTCSMRIGMFVEKFFMVLPWTGGWKWVRSEEHTSELQSLMRISYAVFCLKKKKETNETNELCMRE